MDGPCGWSVRACREDEDEDVRRRRSMHARARWARRRGEHRRASGAHQGALSKLAAGSFTMYGFTMYRTSDATWTQTFHELIPLPRVSRKSALSPVEVFGLEMARTFQPTMINGVQ